MSRLSPPNLRPIEPTAADIRYAIKQHHQFEEAARIRERWAIDHAKDPKRQIVLKSVVTHPATPERAAELMAILMRRTA